MSESTLIASLRKQTEDAGLLFTHHGTGESFYVCIMNQKIGRKRFMNVSNPTEEKIQKAIKFVRNA